MEPKRCLRPFILAPERDVFRRVTVRIHSRATALARSSSNATVRHTGVPARRATAVRSRASAAPANPSELAVRFVPAYTVSTLPQLLHSS
jgi:hypothetical protein